MEEIKEPTVQEKTKTDEATATSKASAPHKKIKKEGSPLDFINGKILTNDSTVKQFPFIMFLVLIALFYISNTYYAEKIMRNTNRVTNEIKELRSEYITSKSDLMFISKQSEVARAAEEKKLGIKESVVAPKKIVIEKSEAAEKSESSN